MGQSDAGIFGLGEGSLSSRPVGGKFYLVEEMAHLISPS